MFPLSELNHCGFAIANTRTFFKPDSPENLYVWTRCLTQMREEMESACDARIFICGRAKGFKGNVLEFGKSFIGVNHNHPIYLVGHMGEYKSIIEALKGEDLLMFRTNIIC